MWQSIDCSSSIIIPIGFEFRIELLIILLVPRRITKVYDKKNHLQDICYFTAIQFNVFACPSNSSRILGIGSSLPVSASASILFII